jgi:Resolvase, N terminal domain
MNKIRNDHLERQAFVYIRQSTMGQVQNHLESKRRQYALGERARALGWQQVQVIDEDQGRSGTGVHRPGFERLLSALCEGQVGRCSASRPRVWRATDATGIHCWSFVGWSMH